MVTVQSLYYGETWHTVCTVKLSGEDLSRYSNKIESVSLGKCPYGMRIITKN